MTDFKKEYSGNYSDIGFQEEWDCECDNACSCSPTYYLRGKREETDIEYNSRVAKEAKNTAADEAREKAEYEKLKKKYGNV